MGFEPTGIEFTIRDYKVIVSGVLKRYWVINKKTNEIIKEIELKEGTKKNIEALLYLMEMVANAERNKA